MRLGYGRQYKLSRSILLIVPVWKIFEFIIVFKLKLMLLKRPDGTLREFGVKIVRICLAGKFGHKWNFKFLSLQGLPVNLLKPRVLFNLVWTVVTESFFEVLKQQLPEQILEFGRELNYLSFDYLAHIDVLVYYWLEELHSVFTAVRRESGHHLVN